MLKNMRKQLNREKNRIFKIVVIVIISVLIHIPFIIEGLYSKPDGDDFHFMYLVKDYLENGCGYLSAAANVVRDEYFTWQGTFTSTFVLSLLSPFIRFGLKGYSVFNTLHIVFFCSSVFAFSYVICKRLNILSLYKTLFIYDCIIVVAFSIELPYSNFYWMTSVVGYFLPLALGFISLTLCMEYLSYKKKNYIIIASFLGMLASGGSLQVAGLICWCLLVLGIYGVIKYKMRANILFPFGASFMGAVINLISPGNFARKGAIENPLSQIILAGKNSVYVVADCWKDVMLSPIFWIGIIFVVYLGQGKTKVTLKKGLLDIFCFVTGICIQTFPVVLGYGTSTIANRSRSIIIFTTIVCIYIYIYAYLYNDRKLTVCVAAGIMTIGLLGNKDIKTENYTIQLWEELLSGEPKRQWDSWNNIYKEIFDSQEQNVTIELDEPFQDDLFVYSSYAHYDGKVFLSPSFIRYTGKDSVTILWDGQEINLEDVGFKKH